MGVFGGGASASNTLSNIISYSPNTAIGDNNKSDIATKLDQKASSEALAKDTTTASVGFGGSGGTVAPNIGETYGQSPVWNSSGQGVGIDKNVLLIGGGVLLMGGFMFFMMNKKRKK